MLFLVFEILCCYSHFLAKRLTGSIIHFTCILYFMLLIFLCLEMEVYVVLLFLWTGHDIFLLYAQQISIICLSGHFYYFQYDFNIFQWSYFVIFFNDFLVISTFLGVAISRGHYCRWEALAPSSPFRPEYIGIFQICTHISFLFWNLHFVSLKFSFHLSKFVSLFLAIICWYILSNSSIYITHLKEFAIVSSSFMVQIW